MLKNLKYLINICNNIIQYFQTQNNNIIIIKYISDLFEWTDKGFFQARESF